MEVIRTVDLWKTYGRKHAVENLQMVVQKGDIYGFIGRNGAGKSTTLKMICGLAAPTKGEIRLFGKSAEDDTVRSRIGMLVENAGLYPGFSAYENMMQKAACLGLADEKKKVWELLELVELSGAGNKKVKNFSMGMKQRLGIAMALLGNPDLLILDEPINGLDPEGILQMRHLLQRLNQEHGITMVISSHILGELSKIATRYGIIKDGRLVEQISADELAQRCRDYLYVKVEQPKEAAVLLEQKLGIDQYEVYPEGELRIYDECDGRAVGRLFAQNGIVAEELFRHQQDLESYFLELMGGEAHV
ncbi:MAG: ATP-binding cassette domain-containing protein [Lachnospiraceae bacterium]|nr:ATP-binding cassette domain-containing protein [Lachnospiraceae bacterium]